MLSMHQLSLSMAEGLVILNMLILAVYWYSVIQKLRWYHQLARQTDIAKSQQIP